MIDGNKNILSFILVNEGCERYQIPSLLTHALFNLEDLWNFIAYYQKTVDGIQLYDFSSVFKSNLTFGSGDKEANILK